MERDDHATMHAAFDEMMDELDANINRIKAEIAREESAFTESI